MIDVHAHAGLPKAAFPVAEELHSALDWGGYRSKDPVGFAAIVSEPQADNTDLMISKMDQNGVTTPSSSRRQETATPTSSSPAWSSAGPIGSLGSTGRSS
jgi:hypothetical protein